MQTMTTRLTRTSTAISSSKVSVPERAQELLLGGLEVAEHRRVMNAAIESMMAQRPRRKPYAQMVIFFRA
jgi:hypothetical protein